MHTDAMNTDAQVPGVARIASQVEAAHTLELDTSLPRILAFGSQLVHGSVGLNATERVYAARSVHALRIPTIVLSAMPHYPSVHHVDIAGGWIADTLNDLVSIGATDDLELVTGGYFTAPAQVEALSDWFLARPAGGRPTLVLDPTLGDIEVGFYTDPALAAAFQEHLIPHATGMTPNLFELAHLTGQRPEKLDTLGVIEAAARSLFSEATEWLVVTGIEMQQDAETIAEMLVTRDSISLHRHPKLRTAAKGLGDTFTAALNVALLRGEALDDAVEFAAAEVRLRAE